MFENTDAVIFDLDGTLVDSMWIWRDIDEEYLARYGLTMPPNLQQDIGRHQHHADGHLFSEAVRH